MFFLQGKEFTILEHVFSLREDMSSLQTLSFSRCSMEILRKEMFLGLEELHTLAFDHCAIAGVDEGAFMHVHRYYTVFFLEMKTLKGS